MSDLKYSVWLSTRVVPGTRTACKLAEHFGYDAEAIYNAEKGEYLAVPGISEKLAEQLSDKNTDQTERILDFCMTHNVSILSFDSKYYPKRLLRLPDFPVILYYKGSLPDIDNEVCIAAVGTRNYTEYGKNNAYVISRDLARAGAIVVSGAAVGIDSFCHRGCLDVMGHTIGVLGCGIDVVYPKSNRDLIYEISLHGTLMTEYPPGTEPAGYNFPKRNRIISGLCLGTLVVEASEGSGALITARTALSQGRDLFALPGNIGEMNSCGTNELIKNGATMITGAYDILAEYDLLFPHKIQTEKILVPMRTLNISNEPYRRVASGNRPVYTSENEYQKEHGNGAGKVPEADANENSGSVKRPKMQREAKNKNFRENVPQKAESDKKTECTLPMSEAEKTVYSAIPENGSITTDEIVRSGIPVSDVLVSLTTLEIKGLIKSLPGGAYAKKHQ